MPFVFTWNTCVRRCVTSNIWVKHCPKPMANFGLAISSESCRSYRSQPPNPQPDLRDPLQITSQKSTSKWGTFEKSHLSDLLVLLVFGGQVALISFDSLSNTCFLKRFSFMDAFVVLPWRIHFSNSSCTATVPPMRDYRHLVMNKYVSCNRAAWNI